MVLRVQGVSLNIVLLFATSRASSDIFGISLIQFPPFVLILVDVAELLLGDIVVPLFSI